MKDICKDHKFFVGKRVLVEATATASQRAKNRIAEKGPWFDVEKTGGMEVAPDFPELFRGNAWLLRGDNDWLGWLRPKEDFEVVMWDGMPLSEEDLASDDCMSIDEFMRQDDDGHPNVCVAHLMVNDPRGGCTCSRCE